MSINLQFDEERREGIEQAWTEWWAGELGRPIVQISDPPRTVFTPHEFTREFIQETPIDECLDYYQSQLENTRYYADALPWFAPLWFGIMGDRVKPMPEQHTVWLEPDEPIPFEDIHRTYNPDYVRSRGMRLRIRALERWGDKVTIDFGGPSVGLQALAFLRTTQQLLYDLYEAPDEVIRASKESTDVSIRQYEDSYNIMKKAGNRGTTSWRSLWSPERGHMHECDFICMISPKMFERFVMPDLERCLPLTNHACWHLDGETAIQHLDRLLSLERLLGIQWVPEAGKSQQASAWMSLLKRIKDAGKLCQFFVDPAGARDIVRELGGRGFCLIIVQWPQMPSEEIDDFLAVLAAEDADAI